MICMKSFEHTYSLSVERHEDGYLAYFPALPGCHTWGVTFEDAVKHAEEALIGYIEAMQAAGQEPPIERSAANVSLGIKVEIPTIV
jgi:predicted RNase H-like HicB family nuclease